MNLWDYELISIFNDKAYPNMLTESHINGTLKLIGNAKDRNGDDLMLNSVLFPMKRGNTLYFLPEQFLTQLPLEVNSSTQISVNKDVYELVHECTPVGFGAIKTFENNWEFLEGFCDYKHTHPKEFKVYKILILASYFKRLNIRVSSNPSFGKNSVVNILRDLVGQIGVVHNPTLPKIEYMLDSKILVTDEVSGIRGSEVDNLQQYYLICGDFRTKYDKRSRALVGGTKEQYELDHLSNVIFFNDITCYPESKRDKYFDALFPEQVKDRFLPFKFTGNITEQFKEKFDKTKIVASNMSFYKKYIKHIKYLDANLSKEVHGWEDPIKPKFTGRYKSNWDKIVGVTDVLSKDEEEFKENLEILYKCHHNYFEMLSEKQQPFAEYTIRGETVA